MAILCPGQCVSIQALWWFIYHSGFISYTEWTAMQLPQGCLGWPIGHFGGSWRAAIDFFFGLRAVPGAYSSLGSIRKDHAASVDHNPPAAKLTSHKTRFDSGCHKWPCEACIGSILQDNHSWGTFHWSVSRGLCQVGTSSHLLSSLGGCEVLVACYSFIWLRSQYVNLALWRIIPVAVFGAISGVMFLFVLLLIWWVPLSLLLWNTSALRLPCYGSTSAEQPSMFWGAVIWEDCWCCNIFLTMQLSSLAPILI